MNDSLEYLLKTLAKEYPDTIEEIASAGFLTVSDYYVRTGWDELYELLVRIANKADTLEQVEEWCKKESLGEESNNLIENESSYVSTKSLTDKGVYTTGGFDVELIADDLCDTFLGLSDTPDKVDQAMMAEEEWKEELAIKNSDRIRQATYYLIEHENVYNEFSVLLDDPEASSVYKIYDKICNHPFEYDINEDEFIDVIGDCNNDEVMAALIEAYTHNKAKANSEFMQEVVPAGISLDLSRDEFEKELDMLIGEYPMTPKEAVPYPTAKTPADPFIHKLKEKYGNGRKR